MCFPLLAAIPAAFAAAGSAVSTAAGAVGTFTAANAGAIALANMALAAGSAVAQSESQRKMYNANADEARRAYTDELEALNARDDEVNRAASDNVFSNEIAALEERGRASASATGTADISLGEVLQNVNARKSIAKGNIEANRVGAIQQNTRMKRAGASGARSRINSVNRPSMTALGFNIAGAAIGGATTYSNLKNRGS